jgi:hypothetical protein
MLCGWAGKETVYIVRCGWWFNVGGAGTALNVGEPADKAHIAYDVATGIKRVRFV